VKKLLQFLVRVTVISLLFIPLLPLFHSFYRFVLVLVATAALPTAAALASLQYDGSANLFTFLVLILGVQGLPPGKRVAAVVAGSGLFLFSDFFMTVIWPYLRTPRPSLANMAVSYGWLVLAHYLLPFLLWFAFAFREIEQLFRGDAGAGEARACPVRQPAHKLPV